MERKENLTPLGENKLGIEIANSQLKQQSTVKIKGTLTSQIRKREETSPYYYAFVKLKGHGADLPVIFRVQERSCQYCEAAWEKQSKCNRSDCGYLAEGKLVKPKLEKGNLVQLTGHYSNSDKNIRKSFTCLTYQLLNKEGGEYFR